MLESVASLMIPGVAATLQGAERCSGRLFTGVGSVTAILISGRLFSVFTPQSLLHTTPEYTFVLQRSQRNVVDSCGHVPTASGSRLTQLSAHCSTSVYLSEYQESSGFLLYRSCYHWRRSIGAMVAVYILDRITVDRRSR